MQTDYVALGLAAHARRAWLRQARSAPLPPAPAPRGRHVSVAELDEAIAAALVRGRNSLEDHMPRVHIKLVPEPAAPRRTPCVVCGLALALALPLHDVCVHCAAAPDASRARLADRRAGHERALSVAHTEAQAALDALSETDRARWNKIAATRLAVARVGRWEGTATPEQQQWLDRVKAAIHNEQSTAVSDALRRAWHADEVAFWAVAGAAEQLRRVDVAAAQLAACLEALEAQGLAVVPSVSAPDTAYQVAKDGSNCTCDGFRFRGTCKHTKKIA
jgi:hypothetical protein